MFRFASRAGHVCLVLLSFVVLVPFAVSAHAASYVVDTTSDSNLTACTSAANDCSLRGAITDANTAGGTNTVTFSVNGTVTLGSLLPQITNDLTITGNGAASTIIDGANNYQVFNIAGSATVSLMDLTVQHGFSADCGGGINNSGTLTVTNCTISGNVSTDLAVSCGEGGGIDNSGTLTVANSTFSGNRANVLGGGIHNAGTATLTNSTFSGNTSTAGGGIFEDGGSVTVTNCTIAGNTAVVGSGGGIFSRGGTTNLNNSIVAHSTSGGDCVNSTGTVNASHSLIGDGLSCVNGTNTANLTGDPQLGTLAGNPAYFPLLSGSPAIDAGNNALAVDANSNPLTTDEAGNARIQGSAVDMGAVEATPPVTAIPTLSWQALAALGLILAALGLLLASKARAS